MVVDTNILLYLANKDDKLEAMLDKTRVYISYITEIELLSYHGITKGENERIINLINDCIIIEMNIEIKIYTIALRKKYRMKVNDAIIAATSLFLDLPLLTADADFIKIKELDLRFYE